jgi:hypothetical protein
MKIIVLLMTFIFSLDGFAVAQRYIMRSPRGMLMGDAYTSIAEDEYTLFYNPALLARHEGFSFNPFNPSFTLSNALKDSSRFSDVSSDPVETADAIMGYPIHLGANLAPGFKFMKFGLSGFAGMETNLNLLNKTNPIMEIDYRLDKGFVTGFAYPLSGSLTKEGGEQVSLGLAAKYIDREGIFEAYPLMGTGLLNASNETETNAMLEALGYTKGRGWGFDFAADFVKRSGTQEIGASLVFMDLYTNIQTHDAPDNDPESKVANQSLDTNFGTHWKQDYGIFDMTLSADVRSLNDFSMDFYRRLHIGVELGLPILRVLAGYNTGYYSYGIMTNLFLIDLYVGFYDIELGEKLGQQRASRAVIYLSLFDFTFDGP